MIAAPNSASGKTTVTAALMRLLADKGYKVGAFKCGPDYIDTQLHAKILGAPSINLDLFFTDDTTVRYLLEKHSEGRDISIIEGVMGYYDGIAGRSAAASSYDIARTTDTPVIFVADVKGMSLSAAALLKGFIEYRADSNIKGVIFNRCSKGMFEILKGIVEEQLDIKALGYLPELDECVFSSRHLGLMLPDEIDNLDKKLAMLAKTLEQTLDLEELFKIAQTPCQVEENKMTDVSEISVLPQSSQKPRVKIAVAKDEAFCFYYADNLSLLEDFGAELEYFSPIHDTVLPSGTAGILLGGGYPENYARQLSENTQMLSTIKTAILDKNIPCLAECGGFLYLHSYMEDLEGKSWKMADVIDAKATYQGKLSRHFGYVTITDRKTQMSIKGHEFHYYESTDNGAECTAQKPLSNKKWDCIHKKGRDGRGDLFVGFAHLYYYSNPSFIEAFLERCRKA